MHIQNRIDWKVRVPCNPFEALGEMGEVAEHLAPCTLPANGTYGKREQRRQARAELRQAQSLSLLRNGRTRCSALGETHIARMSLAFNRSQHNKGEPWSSTRWEFR
jgi:hypothetical protein